MSNWDDKHFSLANTISKWSKDIHTQVGAVIYGPGGEVISVGYNDFPRGVDDTNPARRERPTKYLFTVHAEANAIANAARIGASTKGAAIAVQMFPCPQCMGLILGAGITKLITSKPDMGHPTYGPQYYITDCMIRESGIEVVYKEAIKDEEKPT